MVIMSFMENPKANMEVVTDSPAGTVLLCSSSVPDECLRYRTASGAMLPLLSCNTLTTALKNAHFSEERERKYFVMGVR